MHKCEKCGTVYIGYDCPRCKPQRHIDHWEKEEPDANGIANIYDEMGHEDMVGDDIGDRN